MGFMTKLLDSFRRYGHRLACGGLLVSAFGFSACSTTGKPWGPLESLTGHASPLVSVPANVGAFAGGLAGIPVALAAVPITWPLSAAIGEDGDANLLPLAPMLFVSQVGAVAMGGLPRLVVGASLKPAEPGSVSAPGPVSSPAEHERTERQSDSGGG